LLCPRSTINTNININGVFAVVRKLMFEATLDIMSSGSLATSRFDNRIPLGKRLRRSYLCVSALQQLTSAKSVKWVLDPVVECWSPSFRSQMCSHFMHTVE
jgi:hypothetical protein